MLHDHQPPTPTPSATAGDSAPGQTVVVQPKATTGGGGAPHGGGPYQGMFDGGQHRAAGNGTSSWQQALGAAPVQRQAGAPAGGGNVAGLAGALEQRVLGALRAHVPRIMAQSGSNPSVKSAVAGLHQSLAAFVSQHKGLGADLPLVVRAYGDLLAAFVQSKAASSVALISTAELARRMATEFGNQDDKMCAVEAAATVAKKVAPAQLIARMRQVLEHQKGQPDGQRHDLIDEAVAEMGGSSVDGVKKDGLGPEQFNQIPAKLLGSPDEDWKDLNFHFKAVSFPGSGIESWFPTIQSRVAKGGLMFMDVVKQNGVQHKLMAFSDGRAQRLYNPDGGGTTALTIENIKKQADGDNWTNFTHLTYYGPAKNPWNPAYAGHNKGR